LVTPSIVPGSTYFQAGQGVIDNYKLKQTSYSIFGQVDFKITPRLTISGGGAYLNDKKAVQSFVVLQEPFSALNLQAVPQFPLLGLPGNTYGALGAVQFFYADPTGSTTLVHGPVNIPNANESGIYKGDKFTYAGRIAYDFGPINAYLSYSTGWKASAVNLSSDSRPPNANGVGRFAAPENVTVYEAGLKAKFRGGFFNLAVFKETIKGFQSNGFTGTGYALVNAGEESVRGFEVDAAYRPLSFLSLTGAVTYLDPKYDSFVGAPCFVFDTVRCPINPATGLTPAFRNLTGDKPAGVPEWSASASATLNHDFGNGISAFLRGEYDYTSNTYLTETVPSNIATYGQSQFSASLSVINTDAQLEVTLWGRNLTNDNALIAAFSTVAQSGSYSGYPNQPRTYGVTLRKTF
jgi:iron complex outermembrane receptor protein